MRQAYYADRIGEHRAISPEGYLIVTGVPIARTGWQTYRALELGLDHLPPDTLVEVYRDAAEVFNPTAVSSFEGKSITKAHPPEFLNPDNDREYSKGHVQNVRIGGALPDGERALIGDLWVKDSQLIQFITDGVMDEISCGYLYNLVPMSSDAGIKYEMKDIRGNHTAIVTSGRAGSHVRVLDAMPEEGSNSTMDFKDVVEGFKTLGLRLVPAKATDAESERVNEQEKKDKEALALRQRTMDAAEEEREEKEKKVAKDEEKKEKEEEKKANDAFRKEMRDAVAELSKKIEKKEGTDAKCTCDAEEGEPHKESCPMYKKEGEDADLIPVATLLREDRPRNPIPGADAALAGLKALKPIIAASGDKKAMDAFNVTVTALKKGVAGTDADYAAILAAAGRESPEAKAARERAEAGRPRGVQDAAAIGASYEEEMKKFHRKDPITVVQ